MSDFHNQVNPAHDYESYAILVREDLLADLAHLEPRAVTLLRKGYGLAQRLYDPRLDGELDERMWPPLRVALDNELRLSRSKHGLRSNQLTSSLRGGTDKNAPDEHLSKDYQEEHAWKN